MASGNDSIKKKPKTRQSSLRYHKERVSTPLPDYLAKEAVSFPSDSFRTPPTITHPKQFYFAMNKIGLFGFLLTLTFVGVLLFSSGFLVAYTFYAHSPQMDSTTHQPLSKPTPLTAAKNQQNSQEIQKKSQQAPAEKLGIPTLPAAPKPEEAATSSTSSPASLNSAPSTLDLEDKFLELQDQVTEIPLNPESLQESVQEDIESNATQQMEQFGSEKIQGILNKDAEALQKNTAVVEEISQSPFVIEFGRSDRKETADEMAQTMAQQGIKAEVSRSTDKYGKFTYHVRSPFYKDYETAYNTLNTLTPPFSLWGTIVRGDMKEAPKAKR